mgnify:CR=1 FL=1
MNFKQVYKPSKNKETHAVVSDDISWQQSIRVPFSEFPEMKKEKIGDKICIAVMGALSNMDEKGITIKISHMSLMNAKMSDSSTSKTPPVESYSVKHNILNKSKKEDERKEAKKKFLGNKAEKLGKIFGGK